MYLYRGAYSCVVSVIRLVPEYATTLNNVMSACLTIVPAFWECLNYCLWKVVAGINLPPL